MVLSVVVDGQGRIVTLGQTNSYGAGQNDILLVRKNANGQLIDTRTYGSTNIEQGRHILATNDGGYAVFGSTNGLGAQQYDYYLVKIDANLNVQWSKRYGGSGDDQGRFILQTSDGGYLLSGWVINGFNSQGRDLYMVKTDAMGNIQWTRMLGGTSHEWTGIVKEDNAGNFILAASTQSYGLGQCASYMVKFDPGGNYLWTKSYSGSGYENTYSVNIMNDGYLLVGYTDSYGAGAYDGFVVKTDFNGNLVWSKAYGGNQNDAFTAAKLTPDGGAILFGYTNSFGSGNRDLFLCKIDGIGNLQWSKAFGGVNLDNVDFGENVSLYGNTGYIVAGHTQSYGAGNYDFYVIRTNPNGTSGCNEVSIFSVIVTPASPTVASHTPASSTPSGFANVNTLIGIPPIQSSTLCSNPCSVSLGNDTTICIGQSVQITAMYSPNGGTFLWTPGNLTSQTINVTPLTTTTYIVQYSYNGCISYDSITVFVNPIPIATATPTNQTICSGQITNISLTSNVPGTTFNWTVAQAGVTGAANGSGSTIAQILTTIGPTTGTATYTITPTANGCVGTSITVVITVNPTPIATATPNSQTFCSGGTTNIALMSNIPGTTFNWTVTQTGVTGAANGSGSTIVQTLATTGPTQGNATYTITPTANGCVGTPITVIITVKPIPVATATPANQTICSGQTTNIAITSTTPGTTYSWTVSESGVMGAANGSGNIISQTITTTGLTPGTATYIITPTANGCVGLPITVVITVNPIPIAIATPSSQTFCSGGTTNIALTSNVPGTIFNWTVTQTGVLGAANGSGNTIVQTLTTTGPSLGTAIYTITPTANGCDGNPISITITVNPGPTAVATPAAQTLCSGGTTNIMLTSSIPGTTFIWTVSENGVSGASAGFGNSIVQVLTTTGQVSGTATYTITPTANGCIGLPITVVITVNPIPDVIATPTSQTICSGQETDILLSSSLVGTIFNWTVTQNGTIGANAGSGNTIEQVLTISGTSNGKATYHITATNNGCTNIYSIDVYVLPPPVINLGSDTVICENSSFNKTLLAGNFPAILWNDGSTLKTLSVSTVGTFWVIVTDSNGCSASDTITVSYFQPDFIFGLMHDTTVCADSIFSIYYDTTSYEIKYGLQNMLNGIQITESGNYTFMFNTVCGYYPKTINISAKSCYCDNMFIPNAFTPTNDAINEVFKPVYDCETEFYEFMIFDRWGELIFETNDINKGWDGFYKGRICQIGVYVWKLRYRYYISPRYYTEYGIVNLIR